MTYIMQNLQKIRGNKKRLGRGYGSGKGGHTSGRGQKGQKSRAKIGILFEGVKVKKSFIKRLPFMRGKAKFKPARKPIHVNLDDLSVLGKDAKVVDVAVLVSSGVVDIKKSQKFGVKILGKGNINKKLTFALPVSKPAALKIKKAGGEVIIK